MSYQNNIAKVSLSLQNHIVRPCFIFITQNTPNMHNLDDKLSNCFILFNTRQLFSTLTQYMSVSHGHNTKVVKDGGCEDKKRQKIVSHQLGVSTGYGDAHQLGEESLTSTTRINGLRRCTSIDINVSEQGLPCNGCTRAINV